MRHNPPQHPFVRVARAVSLNVKKAPYHPDAITNRGGYWKNNAVYNSKHLHTCPILKSVLMCTLDTIKLLCVFVIRGCVQCRVLNIILLSSLNHLNII